MFKEIRVITILLLISIQPILAQVEYFNRIYTQHSLSKAFAVVEQDSFYFVAGNLIDSTLAGYQRIYFNKHAKNGDVIWTKSWGESGKAYSVGWTSPMIITSDNGFALVGGIIDSTNFWHGILVKLNSDGDTVWMKHFYDTISLDPHNFFGSFTLRETNDKGFIIAGEISATYQWDNDVLLLKTDSLGNTEWLRTYGYVKTMDRGYSVIQTPDSGYVIGGDSWRAGMDYALDAYLIRTDKEGNKIWDKFLGGPKSDLLAFISLSYDSNYLVGYSYAYEENLPAPAQRTICVVKISPQKQMIWGKTFWIHMDHTVRNIYELNDHSIIIVGRSWFYDSFNQIGGPISFIMKLSENGDSLWFRDYTHIPQISSSIFNYLVDIKPTSDGGLIACGDYRNIFAGVNTAAWLVKTDSLGCDTPGCIIVGVKESQLAWDIQELNIYPNPASEYINIEINQILYEPLLFELFDKFGRLVKKYKIMRPSDRISLARLSVGMYFYRVRSKSRILWKDKLLIIN